MSSFQIIVINLKRSSSRWKRLKPQLEETRVEFERFEAIDGKHLPRAEYSTLVSPEAMACAKRSFRSKVSDLSWGSLGCFLSHALIWKKVESNVTNRDFYLILEDDVKVESDLKTKVDRAIGNAPKDWGLLHIGENWHESGPLELKTVHIRDTSWESKNSILANAYLLKPDFATELLKNAFPIPNIQVDFYINDHRKTHPNKIWFIQSPIITLDKSSSTWSQINHSPMDLPIWEFIVIAVAIVLVIVIILSFIPLMKASALKENKAKST
jgi:GR25 family glycosyltransferase involved in LPS biosynthesis